MSKQKPNPPQPDEHNLAGHFDRKSIHEAMTMAKGNAAEAYKILQQAGLDKTQKWLYDQLHADHVLKSVWVDGRGNYAQHEPVADLSPADVKAIESELIKRDAEFIDRHGADKVFGDDAPLMLDFADFASKSFQTTVNITYGISVVCAKNLYLRADTIDREILRNTETVARTDQDKDGNIVQYQGPKYTEAEKLEWQKAYNDIMDKLCKFNTATTGAANAKIAAYKAQLGQGNRKKTKSARSGRDLH